MPVAASPFIHQRNELILRAWEMGMPTARICSSLDVTRNVVENTVHAARSAGDVRAVSRKDAPRPLKPDGPTTLGREYYRRWMANHRAKKRDAAWAYADGSAWDRASA